MNNLPLREKKFARTKVAITFNLIEKLLHTPFENISVKEICREVEISEATFFNYFPKKSDIIDYYTTLKMYQNFWNLKEKNKITTNPIENIKSFFAVMAESTRPTVFNEIFCFYLKNKHYDNMKCKISATEKIIAFPECKGIEELPPMTTHEFFTQELKKAINEKLINESTDVVKTVTILHIIMYGSLVFAHTDPKNDLKDYYKTQLNSTFESLK